MPTKLVNELATKIESVQKSLKTHLEEGVEIKLAIARLQVEQRWLGVVGLLILSAIVGLYFKR